jgi:hypothetical protein
MKGVAVPGWVKEEWALLGYLTNAHDGHPYAEELLEGISLLTSWVLVVISIVSVIAVIGDALLR